MNERFVELAPEGGGNLEWIKRALEHKVMQGEETAEGKHDTLLLLLGAADRYGFRLRIAQSHARHDLVTSDWSHVALLQEPQDDIASATVVEVSLAPRRGFGWPVETNGIQRTPLLHYRSARAFPNIALVRLPVSWEAVSQQLDWLSRERRALDLNGLVLAWLSFVWGVAGTSNPLLEGMGVPSAVMVETVVANAGYELTPGLDSGLSCPEAIWQTCRWWHPYYDQAGGKNAPRGCWLRRHRTEAKLGLLA